MNWKFTEMIILRFTVFILAQKSNLLLLGMWTQPIVATCELINSQDKIEQVYTSSFWFCQFTNMT